MTRILPVCLGVGVLAVGALLADNPMLFAGMIALEGVIILATVLKGTRL